MRAIVSLGAVLLFAAGCNVDNDPANEKVTVHYDRERIHKAGHVAKEVASGAASVAKTTGKAIKHEVGDIDVKVTRTSAAEKRRQEAEAAGAAPRPAAT